MFPRGTSTLASPTFTGTVTATGAPIVGFEDKGGQLFNIKAYGAVIDGTTDDYVAVQAATTAAVAVGGIVFHPGGKCVLGAAITVAGSCQFLGVGESSIYFLKASIATVAGLVLFNLGSGGDAENWTFADLLIDGNGANQVFTGSTISTFFKAISADGNVGGNATGPTLKVRNVMIQNFTMLGTTTIGQGIALNGFGSVNGLVDGFKTYNCDTSLEITEAFTTTPCRWVVSNFDFHNSLVQAIYFEGTPTTGTGAVGGAAVTNGQIVSDAASSATAITILSTNPTSKILLNNIYIENMGYPVKVGGGGTYLLTDSTIANIVAKNCKGSFNLLQVGAGCVFSNLTADTCASGGITGSTVYGSFELGYSGAPIPTIINGLYCINSQNQAIQNFGPCIVNGGSIRGGNTVVSFNNGGTNAIRNVDGYNPAGATHPGVAFAIGATTVAATNLTGVDGTLYVTAAGTVTAVSVNGVVVSTVLAVGDTYRLVVGGTLTMTYAVAPTLVFVGD